MQDYSVLSKDDLVEEIKRRKIKANLRAGKAELVSVLKMDDVENNPAQVKPTKSLQDQIPAQPEMPTAPTQPNDKAFANGFKVKHNVDGFIYECICDPTDEVKPYKARVPKQASGHPGLYWDGSEADFKDTFSKV